jgi:formate dehydrogenase maturation protein FdhE
MELTRVKKEEYIDRIGTMCPYCGSAKTIDGNITDKGSYCLRNMSCYDCHKQWNDIYTLTDIEEI